MFSCPPRILSLRQHLSHGTPDPTHGPCLVAAKQRDTSGPPCVPMIEEAHARQPLDYDLACLDRIMDAPAVYPRLQSTGQRSHLCQPNLRLSETDTHRNRQYCIRRRKSSSERIRTSICHVNLILDFDVSWTRRSMKSWLQDARVILLKPVVPSVDEKFYNGARCEHFCEQELSRKRERTDVFENFFLKESPCLAKGASS